MNINFIITNNLNVNKVIKLIIIKINYFFLQLILI